MHGLEAIQSLVREIWGNCDDWVVVGPPRHERQQTKSMPIC